jgi:parallel beta-helix repeat protein
MSLNQKQITDLVFADVTAAEAAGRPGEICYVQSLKTFYDYVVAGSAYTVDHTSILSTGNAGNTRWRARAGQYVADVVTFSDQVRGSKGADVASASALPVLTDGNYFDVTGTNAITSINTLGVGTVITLHFDAILILTHNATDLILPGGANIATAAGDEAIFREYATGDWRCICYTKADGTAVVAANSLPEATTPTNSKGNAFSTIQAAINDMDVAGWVYVPPGTYTEAVDIIGKNNLMLFGAGWGMTKITYAGADHTLDIDNSDDVIIRDIRIDQTSTGNSVNAIRLDDAQRCKIRAVYIGDADNSGIDFLDVASIDCEITECYITGADYAGIEEEGAGLCANLKIRNNIITCCGMGTSLFSDNCLFENNTLKSNTTVGIEITDGDYLIITGNLCIDNGHTGIYIENSNHSIIANNICINNSQTSANTYDGIFVDTCCYTTISNNICYDDHSGCSLAGCQRHGIYVHFNSNYNAISGSVCRNNRSDGIKIHGTTGNLADYNTLNGNVCEGNGGKGIYIFGDKANVHDYANKNIVLGNQLFDNTGVNLDDDGTATELGHNITA